jgi:hypothetical protein
MAFERFEADQATPKPTSEITTSSYRSNPRLPRYGRHLDLHDVFLRHHREVQAHSQLRVSHKGGAKQRII